MVYQRVMYNGNKRGSGGFLADFRARGGKKKGDLGESITPLEKTTISNNVSVM